MFALIQMYNYCLAHFVCVWGGTARNLTYLPSRYCFSQRYSYVGKVGKICILFFFCYAYMRIMYSLCVEVYVVKPDLGQSSVATYLNAEGSLL